MKQALSSQNNELSILYESYYLQLVQRAMSLSEITLIWFHWARWLDYPFTKEMSTQGLSIKVVLARGVQ